MHGFIIMEEGPSDQRDSEVQVLFATGELESSKAACDYLGTTKKAG